MWLVESCLWWKLVWSNNLKECVQSLYSQTPIYRAPWFTQPDSFPPRVLFQWIGVLLYLFHIYFLKVPVFDWLINWQLQIIIWKNFESMNYTQECSRFLLLEAMRWSIIRTAQLAVWALQCYECKKRKSQLPFSATSGASSGENGEIKCSAENFLVYHSSACVMWTVH